MIRTLEQTDRPTKENMIIALKETLVTGINQQSMLELVIPMLSLEFIFEYFWQFQWQ